MQKPLVLVDGSSYLFRAYHALPPLTNSQGEPTGAIYGVANMLKRLLQDYDPTHCCVVFDAKGKTFRSELYPEYKANRGAMPEELAVQVEPLLNLITALGFPLIRIKGVEADDVIGTLVTKFDKYPIIVSTGDKDFAQLVNEHVTLVNTMSDSTLDIAGVEKKFGIKPELIIDYLTLIGDTSDNIPGVPKVGPKTAVKWLQQYGSLDEVIAHADEIKGKVGENLRKSLDYLPLSKQLVTIKTDVPLDEINLDFLCLKKPETAHLFDIYTQYEFKNWLRDLEQEHIPNIDMQSKKIKNSVEYHTILTEDALEIWLNKIKDTDLLCFDTETTSLDINSAEIVGLSLAVEPNEAAYIPIGHDYPNAPEQLSRETVFEKLKPILENAKIKKLGHNLKYDLSVCINNGIKLSGIAEDSMLESYMINSVSSRHDLDTLSEKYLHKQTIHFEDVAGKGAKQVTFDKVAIEKASPYACEDVDMSLQLHKKFQPELQSLPAVNEIYKTIEIPLLSVLAQMERNGVKIDEKKLAKQSEILANKKDVLQEKIYGLAGEEFNIDSPKQLQKILYDKLSLPVLAKTPKGQASTAESVLSELALEYELPNLILEYRSMSKLKSTYTDKLPLMINKKTKRLHTAFHQAVTATGRLSSSEPNLQNIPIRREEGKMIRQAFIVPNGYKMLAADYSQIELRIMAHLSEDKGLLTAFENNEDIHVSTASEVFGVEKNKVTKDMRRSAKAVNFGLIYGMSAFGLAKQLGVSREQAQSYIDIYFARYPGVAKYMDKTRAFAKKHGFIETVLGRRLYLPDINSSQRPRRMAAERAAINAPMQGTAADIIKLAMIACDNWIKNKAPNVKMIIQVHDELVFEVPEEDLDKAKQGISKCMVEAFNLETPLVVDVGMGNNWEQAH